MILVPPWVASTLRLQAEYADEAALHADLSDFEGHDALRYVGADDLVAALLASAFKRIDLVRVERSTPWRFARLSMGNGNQCLLVELPDSDGFEEVPPSAAICALIRAWITADAFRLDHLIERHASNVLVAWESVADELFANSDLCVSLAGVPLPVRVRPQPMASCASANIAVPADALILKEGRVYHEIMQQALQSSSASLRFLYLYRILERAYLINALEKLKDGFFVDPQQSIKVANDTVSNEKNSFIALIDGGVAEEIFAEIEDIFSDAEKNLNNRFMIALKKSIGNEESYREAWKRGCALIYKMRCAIVHSGKGGPIFESFSDSAEACERVNGKLEKAAFVVLGVGIS